MGLTGLDIDLNEMSDSVYVERVKGQLRKICTALSSSVAMYSFISPQIKPAFLFVWFCDTHCWKITPTAGKFQAA